MHVAPILLNLKRKVCFWASWASSHHVIAKVKGHRSGPVNCHYVDNVCRELLLGPVQLSDVRVVGVGRVVRAACHGSGLSKLNSVLFQAGRERWAGVTAARIDQSYDKWPIFY